MSRLGGEPAISRPKRGFWPLRDLPALLWLLALVVTTLVHPFVPAPRWLMIHLLLLGAVSHSILVWSRHFADALLHTAPPPGDRRAVSARLLLLNVGTLTVIVGVLGALWPVTVLGAASVAVAAVWHGAALLVQLRRALPARFGITVRYYVTAACLLPVGAALGATLARDLPDPWHQRLLLAHVAINLFGWVGLTVAGTLVTLWPAMLRTRIAPGSEAAASRALPVLVLAILVLAGGALAGWPLVAALGVAGYLAGLGPVAFTFITAARGKRPSSYSTWSVLAGLAWLVGCLVALAIGIGTAPDWLVAGERLSAITPLLAAGFGAQVLLGALSYLVPVALRGGPIPVRAATAVLDRGGPLRIVMINGGLLVWALPVPSAVRVLVSAVALGGLAVYIPLVILAIRASRRAKQELAAGRPAAATGRPPAPERPGGTVRPVRPEGERPPGQARGLALTGLAVVVLAVAAGVAVDPTALGSAAGAATASSGARATGQITTVKVSAAHMRFSPSAIRVPAGNRLVIELTNTDPHDVHDLVLDSGQRSPRLAPGATARIEVGVIGRDLEGWCSVVGHRQLGMVLHVAAAGTGPAGAATPGTAGDPVGRHEHRPVAGAAQGIDPMAAPTPGFTARDARLPALTEERVHRQTITIHEQVAEVAPGVTQRLWTFDGAMPGPTLHGRVGDVFEITLRNGGTIGHSIDFHAGSLAPDQAMRTIPPGESLLYRFTATKAGIWMYHCSSMPMSAHIANGMFGAVVIEPPDLPPVARSYVLVQSELYLGGPGEPVDMEKLRAERPDGVVFNGYANQYDHQMLPAKAGERIRIWVLDAGPNRSGSFHVVGGQFDTMYAEGGYLLRPGPGGAQSLALAPAQGGFVELAFPEAGHYPFVSHLMLDAERGAHGTFDITN